MEFDKLSLSRDFLYLFSLFAGTGVGSLLSVFKRENTLWNRSAWISLALFLFSGAVASIAASVIFSRGGIFSVSPVYLPAIITFVLGVLAVRFPCVGGCTLIFAAGLCAVWICVSFLRFPRFDYEKPEISLQARGEGLLIVNRRARKPETWNIKNDREPGSAGEPLEFEAVTFTAAFPWPVIGGKKRGLITQIKRGSETVFSAGGRGLNAAGKALGTVQHFSLTLPAEALPPGIHVSVLFDGEKLYLDPPVPLP